MKATSSERLSRYFWFAHVSILACWGIASFNSILRYFAQNTLFAFSANNYLCVTDFVCQYNGALLAKQCELHPVNIYDPDLQYAGILQLVSPLKPEPVWFLQYPPQFFALVKPLAYFSLQNAYLIWCGIALILIIWSVHQLGKQLIGNRFAEWFLLIATLSAHPASFAFSNGNTTLYNFPALVWYWLFLKKKRYVAAGFVSVAFLIKIQFLPFLILLGCLLGGWRYLIAFSVPSLLYMAYTVATLGWGNLINYPSALHFLETHAKSVASEIMQNLRGEILMFFPSTPVTDAIVLLGYSAGILATLCMWKWLVPRMAKTIGDKAFNLAASITVLLMLVLSPHTHIQDYINISIVAAFLYSSFQTATTRTIWQHIARWLLLIFPIYSWLTILLFVFMVRIHMQPYFLWACILLIVLIADVRSTLKNKITTPSS